MTNPVNDIIKNYIKSNEEKMYYVCHDVENIDDDRITYYDSEMAKRGWEVKSKKLLADVFDVTLDCEVVYVRKIDKKGEDNITEYKPFVEAIKNMNHDDIIVSKNENFAILKRNGYYYQYNTETKSTIRRLMLTDEWLKREFKLQSKFVNFEEAVKAVKENKIVHWVTKDGNKICLLNSMFSFGSLATDNAIFANYGFNSLFNGKFIIKD